MTKPQEDLVVLDAEPGVFGFFGWHNVIVVVWSGASGIAYLTRLARVSADMRERYPDGGSSIYLVRPSAALPDGPTRTGLMRLEQQYSDWVGGIGVVIGGGGFWASTMRSVVTAMRVASSRAYDLRLFGSFEEVVAWLPAVHLKKTRVPLDPAQLLAALHKADAQEAAAAEAVQR